ncbi:HAD hydrolase-like protein [Streptomyces sp. NPDC006335]|uniref:HAD hydrolase-like protein n=1 Tax=Streptomyces sp. NPDC006335 TaxID=3156895 RepID=UPI0033BA5C39
MASAALHQVPAKHEHRRDLHLFGLDTLILWELGAYGEDHDVRAGLVRLSLERADTAADAAVLIGDTPADIEGAHTNGVRVIAVAGGRSDEAALLGAGAGAGAGAEVVLPDLRDTDLLVKLVRNGT